MGFFHSFMVVIPVFVPLVQGYGLSMSEVLQTQALFAITVALTEVPSGYIADLWGRKRAILLGSLLSGFGFLALVWADSFADFLRYEFILGLGVSLISGADLALLYDSETLLLEQEEGGAAGASRSLSRLISIEAGASGIAGIVASLPIIGLLGMAFLGGWGGVMFGLVIQVSRGLSLTVFYDALNRRVPGDFRATVNSLVSLGVRGIFIVTGPGLGYLLDQRGMHVTLVILACVFAPLFLLVIAGLGSRIRREGGAHEAEPLSVI